MTEIFFYHVEGGEIDEVLPELVAKTLARGWRAMIRVESAERAAAIDRLLWAYDDTTFLPHAQAGDGDSACQPVLITVAQDNVNHANVLILVGGTETPEWSSVAGLFLRIVFVLDGHDLAATAAADAARKSALAAGHEVAYWRLAPGGKWKKQV